ncbi:ferritin [Chitiniphilus eburneus]|uniref:Ferritin n=1 Tax=Chitiniphilus eburneus TaxID=2571148 RepID=A0A4U0QCM9_9NEIS|nr:ferritin [Chitiniphilus eburneus]TJZ79183.1 ferritin [Chitiniphilus eburneus]
MPNHDEAALRARRLLPGSRIPPLHQALRLALYDQYATRAFHARVIESFGAKAPFPAALRACEQHIAQCVSLCRGLGIPLPLDPFPAETRVGLSWRINCERAARGEASKAECHAMLLSSIAQPDARALLRRLQRDALNRRLPEFARATATAMEQERMHAAQGVAPADAYVQHGPMANFLEQAFSVLGSQHSAFGVVGPLLRGVQPALLAGLIAGGAGTYFVKHQARRHGKEGRP